MFYNHRIAVVIPAYQVEKWIQGVLEGIPDYIDHIIVVDDKSADGTARKVTAVSDPRIRLIHHATNRGVGGAMRTGFEEAVKLAVDICVKMDGDGQMDPAYLPALLYPLVLKECDYTKGNRFSFVADNRSMPRVRRLGSGFLTFLSKVCSGYWHIFDPQNGYLAIRSDCLRRFPLKWIDETYFFENSMLISLNIIDARVSDVVIPSRYGDQESSMSITWVVTRFPFKLINGFLHRVSCRYMYRDVSPVAIMLLSGSFLTLGGSGWGAWAWYRSLVDGVDTTVGALALGLIPILLGSQLLLSALMQDIQLSISGRQKVYDFSRAELKEIVGHSTELAKPKVSLDS
jgi:dolichol-phosphate mannosyltransferase